MITQSNISTVDYTRAEELKFEGLLALTVVNTGFWPMLANDVLLKTGESYEFIKPDGTICNFNLTTKFIDGKGVFIEPAGMISQNDISFGVALYTDVDTKQWKIDTVRDNFMFTVKRVPDDLPLEVQNAIMKRQDGKFFVFKQSPSDASYYNISEYIELFNEVGLSTYEIIRPLFHYNQFENPQFGTKSYRVISKRII